MENTTEHTQVPESAPTLNVMPSETIMVVLTWITFFLLLVLLHKFAWRPILNIVQNREKEIRDALENADKAKVQLAQVEEEKLRLLNEAKTQAAKIIEESRKTARDLAANIEAKSRQEAQNLVQSAHEEIAGERQRLLKSLRQESAEVAISLASKIIQENMDQDKNRRLVQNEIEQL
jgi:F-type H+-transporting ATPase subunit b